MAFALVNNAQTAGSAAGGQATGAFSATGGNFIAASTNYFNTGSVAGAPTDNLGNTYTAAVNVSSSGGSNSAIHYAENPTVSGSLNVTCHAAISVMEVAVFSGAVTVSVFDSATSFYQTVSGTSIQPGSRTPANDNSLIVSACGALASGAQSINSGFTITNQLTFSSGVNSSGALSYLIQGAKAAVNPTWTTDGGGFGYTASIAVFVAAAVAGGSGPIMGGSIMRGAIMGGRIMG